MARCGRITLLSICLVCSACQSTHSAKTEMADRYLDLCVTYSMHARSLWHDADVGGYWGGGIDDKNQNGAVRGMCSTMLGYATLVHAMDRGWVAPDLAHKLEAAGL